MIKEKVPKWMKTLIADNLLHGVWMLATLGLFAIFQNTLTFFTATLWWIPREYIDQWGGWPLSYSKKVETLFWTLFSIITTVVYHFT